MLRSKSALFVVLSLGVGLAACRDERAVGEERNRGTDPVGQQGTTATPPATGRTGPDTSLLGGDRGSEAAPQAAGGGTKPIDVQIQAASGSDVSGTARFVEEKDGVRITVEFAKAPPGKHGLHIHEKGDCSDPKAESAGGHFHLPGQKHGIPEGGRHDGDDKNANVHLGDLGNIEIGQDGKGKLEHFIQGVNLKMDAPESLVGRGIILHAKEDKGTQPSGDSGARIGCGAIRSVDAGGKPSLGADPEKSPHTTPGAVKPENAAPVGKPGADAPKVGPGAPGTPGTRP